MEKQERTGLFSEFPPVATREWEEKILTDLKGADYQKKLIWKTDEGFDVKPYYRAEDIAGLEHLSTLPGRSPYVRGLRKSGNGWRIREDISSTDIIVANLMARDAICKGADEVGLMANEVTTHDQLNRLLDGIDLQKTAVNFISAQSYPLVLEFLVYELTQRGIGGESLRGSLNFDPISYLLLHGEFYISPENDLEEAEYLLGIIRSKLPGFSLLNINGHYFQDSGSTLVQELAFSLASATEYFALLTGRGISIDDIAPYTRFSLAIGPNYFSEMAKLRAARLLWTNMVRHFGAKREESYRLFIHCSTAAWNKSVFDPYVNLLRTTTEGMSAALGNADSVSITPFDAAYKEPDEISRRIARNQQLVMKEEAYLDKIADPGAGAYYIENLTDQTARRAWDLFREIETRGGMLECIKSGFVQDEIAQTRDKKLADVAQRRMIMLGTNQYPNPAETMSEMVSSAAAVQEPVSSTFKQLRPFRVTAGFEEVRLAAERFVGKGGRRPSVFLLTMGNLAMLRARAGFAANFFGCAGYEIIDNPGFATTAEGVEAALSSGSQVVVICSSDEEYPAIVPDIARQIKNQEKKIILVVAGFPKDLVDTFRAAGVDEFIHVRSNLLETLTEFNRKLGITMID